MSSPSSVAAPTSDINLPISRIKNARLGVSAAFFANGFYSASLFIELPQIKQAMALSDSQVGSMLLASTIGGLSALPFSGWMNLRFGSRRVAFIGTTMMLACFALLSILPPYLLLVPLYGLIGLLASFVSIAFNSQGTQIEQAMQRPIFSSIHAMFSFGGFTAAAFGSLLLHSFGMTTHILIVAAISLAITAYVTPHFLKDKPSVKSTRSPLQMPKKAAISLGLIGILAFSAEAAMQNWCAIFMHAAHDLDASMAAYALISFNLGMAIGRSTGDIVRRHLNAVTLFRFSGALGSLGQAVALTSPSIAVAVAAFGLVGLGVANLVPVIYLSAAKIVGISPTEGIASVATIGNFGALFAPMLIGVLADHTSMQMALMPIVGSFAIIAIMARVTTGADSKASMAAQHA